MPRPFCFATPTAPCTPRNISTKNELHFFTLQSSAAPEKRLELETCLRRALERDEFQMYYQPQVDLNGPARQSGSAACVGSPELGRVPPSEFIPIAEETGMIVPIGAWVLHGRAVKSPAWRLRRIASLCPSQ